MIQLTKHVCDCGVGVQASMHTCYGGVGGIYIYIQLRQSASAQGALQALHAGGPAMFFEELPYAKTKIEELCRFYDLSSVGFHARAYDGHMHVVGDWHMQVYDLEGVEAALAQGLLMQVRNGRKRIVCLDYGLDATLNMHVFCFPA